MINVLIADDELWIRKWLKKMVSDYSNNVNIVAVVDNGAAALEVIKNNDIDIVISDIQMQQFTGLELSALVNKNYKNIKFIIVSGYDYFSYAKEAIQNDVIGYLLKPLDKEELYETLDKAIKMLKEERNTVKDENLLETAVESMFFKWLEENDSKYLHKLNELFLENGLIFKSYIVCCLQLDICQNIQDNTEFMLKKIFRNRLKNKNIYIVKKSKLVYYIIICNLKDKRLLYECNYFLLHDLKEKYNYIDLSISEELYKLSKVNQYIEKKEIENKNYVDITDNIKLSALASNIILNIKGRKRKELEENIQYARNLYENNRYSNVEIKYWIINIVSSILHYIESLTVESGMELKNKGYEFIANTNNYINVISMINWLQSYGDEIINTLEKEKYNNVSDIVSKVNNYMLKYYYEDINITSICEKYDINPSYFSKKFKDEMGINFIDMLNNIRINASVEMIENTDDTIKTIGERCGFKDPRYFSKVFYKYMGINPTEYRNKYKNTGVSHEN